MKQTKERHFTDKKRWKTMDGKIQDSEITKSLEKSTLLFQLLVINIKEIKQKKK